MPPDQKEETSEKLDPELSALVWDDWVVSERIRVSVEEILTRIVDRSYAQCKIGLDGRPGVSVRPSKVGWTWSLQFDSRDGRRLGQVSFEIPEEDVEQLTVRVRISLLQSSPFGGKLEDARKRAHDYMTIHGWTDSFSRNGLGRNDLAVRNISAEEVASERKTNVEAGIDALVGLVVEAVVERAGRLFEAWAEEVDKPAETPPVET